MTKLLPSVLATLLGLSLAPSASASDKAQSRLFRGKFLVAGDLGRL